MNQNTEEEFSPDELANFIFSDLPKEPCSISIIPSNKEDNIEFTNDDLTFIFEILLSVYMEGIIDVERLILINTSKKIIDKDHNLYDKPINLSYINQNILEYVKPWFMSLGYIINVIEYEDESIFKEYLNNYYSKIVLRDNPHDYGFFFFNKIPKPYHFILNGNYKPVKSLKELFAIFIKPKSATEPEKYYTISFSNII